MNLNLRVEWIRKLKNKKLVEDFKWSSPENWRSINIKQLRSQDLDDLLAHMEKINGETGALAVKQKIVTYRKLLVDVKGVKISRLEPLVEAIRLLMMPTPHKWLFKEERDGYLVPYYVYNVSYTPPNDDGRPADTTVDMVACYRGRKDSETLTYHQDDIGDTAYELLRKRGYFLETPALVETYEKENKRHQEISGLTGEQFEGRGMAKHTSRYDSDTSSLIRDGKPALLVMDDESPDGGSGNEGERIVISSKFWMKQGAAEEEAEDDEMDADESHVYMPVHPYVKMFDLTKHQFVETHVMNLTEYVYDSTVINKLVIPEEHKELIEILVTGSETQMEDIVKGKTGGIIVLSTGYPGVGKTLTAEVYSEQVKRPLYRVQCSQLGIDAEDLEKQLKIVLSRAQRWKAILLIDEADVYIHSRDKDIVQNAIVGVFLRILEYYAGVMFLTSNRATVIDDAILSRATAWLRYAIPDREKAIHIWNVLSTQYQVKLQPKDIEALADVPAFKRISGRSIKNLLRLAKLMAVRKRKPVTVESLTYVSQFIDLEPAEEPAVVTT